MVHTPPILDIDASKYANNTQKTESIKNKTVCSNLDSSHTSLTPKILKNHESWGNLYINLLENNSGFYHASVILNNSGTERKVSVFFSKIKSTITISYPKGFTWHKQ